MAAVYQSMAATFLQSSLNLAAITAIRQFYCSIDTQPEPLVYEHFPTPLQPGAVRLVVLKPCVEDELVSKACQACQDILFAVPEGDCCMQYLTHIVSSACRSTTRLMGKTSLEQLQQECCTWLMRHVLTWKQLVALTCRPAYNSQTVPTIISCSNLHTETLQSTLSHCKSMLTDVAYLYCRHVPAMNPNMQYRIQALPCRHATTCQQS